MNNVIISHLLAAASIILLVICILPRRKPVTRSAMIAHALCGVALAVLALLHGLLANDTPAMLSGKIAWIALMLLLLSAMPKSLRRKAGWMKIHRTLSVCVFLLILVHILHAMLI